jgi:predicted CxxxxCH...CXXCH cytochrome family protein
MIECQKCHGNDFSGNGSNQLNCRNCHNQAAGPLACNTCHGNFGDPTRIAPPRDINGNTSTDIITIGAHVSHLYTNNFAVVACENCHIVPNANNVKSHFNSAKLVELDSLAIHGIASNALFDTISGTCSNIYCHGNFEFKKSDAPSERQFAYTSDKMTGNNRTVKWTLLDGSQAPCGSCHGTTDGFISPEGHIKVPIQECVACHSTVINEKGEIIDKTRHINGQINYALGKKK